MIIAQRVHVIGLVVNHGLLEDPVLVTFFATFGELFHKLAVNAPGKRVLVVRAVLRLWRDGRVQIGLISLLLKL